MDHIDDPAKLRQAVLDHRDSISALPWDDQVEYGKRYRTLKLIGASIK